MKTGLLVSLTAALTLSACSPPEQPKLAPRPVVVTTVGAPADAAWSVYSGEVRARHEVDQSFRVGGKIAARLVSLGDRVHKGQALARLDPQDLQLSASATQAQVAAATADVRLAQAELERARNLAAQRFISSSALETRQTQLDAAQARLSQAKAQASISSNQIGYTTLVADRDGVVTALPVEAGQVVAAGQAVARVADPGELEVLIWIPETRAASIKPGAAAMVRPWNAQEQTLPAQVREVAASADTVTRTYAVRVKLNQAAGDLKLGSTAAVAFAATRADTAVTVPLPAVTKGTQGTQVWVVDANNAVQARTVEVADYRDDTATIAKGLASGDRVVSVGAHALTAGMTVRPVEQKTPVALDVTR
jgi:multidrug efflux system membrane fusion protein